MSSERWRVPVQPAATAKEAQVKGARVCTCRHNGGVSAPRDVPIREETIRLGQFLKLADVVDNGAEAKPLLMQGLVWVNGELETRRGRQLVKGDVVTVGEGGVEAVRVV
jgi:ribosome-associated protein